jgi:hypothetical protein
MTRGVGLDLHYLTQQAILPTSIINKVVVEHALDTHALKNPAIVPSAKRHLHVECCAGVYPAKGTLACVIQRDQYPHAT